MTDSPRDSTGGDDSTTTDDQWRFGIDEVGEDAEQVQELPPIEPGNPSLENALFVLIGVVGTLLVLLSV